MNIFKKVSAAALAAVVTTSCLTAVASAKDEQLKLLISPISIKQANGELATTESDFISIDVDSWQKSGEFAYSTVKTDFEIPEDYGWWLDADGKYGYFIKPGEELNSMRVFKYDEKTEKLSTVKDFGTGWGNVSDECYVFSRKADDTAKTFSITITSPDGKSKTHSFAYKGKGDYDWNYRLVDSEKYVACVLWKTGEREVTYGENKTTAYSYDIYGITKNGELETIFSDPGSDEMFVDYFGDLSGGNNCVSWSESRRPFSTKTCIYDFDTGKTVYGANFLEDYAFDGAVMCRYTNGIASSRIVGVDLYGDRFIAKCPVDFTTSPYEYRYVLFEIGNFSETGMQSYKNLTDIYKSMSTEDGKIFLVKTEDDKWGYIDANGKELALFDDAGNFVGDYAPVVKDGKAYLIDKNMNCVSEKIDADSVTSIANNSKMFKFTKDGKTYLATFAAPAPETSEPTSSETSGESTSSETSGETTSSETSSSTSDSTSGNPDTGAVGIGFIAGAAALCGAVVVLSRKKK